MRLTLLQLEDRLAPANTTIPAGEFNWLQATPNGGLAELVWEGKMLTYRTRVGTGWNAEAIVADPSYYASNIYNSLYRIERANQAAQLAFTPDGTPHAFLLSTRDPSNNTTLDLILHYRRGASGWSLAESLSPGFSFTSADNLTSVVGPNGVFHLLVHRTIDLNGGSGGQGELLYATNKTGSWSIGRAFTTADQSRDIFFYGQRYLPRFLSIAADSQNFAHITYSTGFLSSGDFSAVRSDLGYASNKTGAWVQETVFSPPDGTGDAGLGASVAIGPGDVPAIASYFVDRVATGSPASSQLLYHARVGNGWASSVAVSAPDGYVAGDGALFTGFAPQLRFEGITPVITFSDVGAQHLPVSFANEMAGQIRETRLIPGGWFTVTVFRQSNPLVNEVYFPVAAVLNGQAVYAALQAVNELDENLEIVSKTHTLIDLNAPAIEGSEPGLPGGPLGAGVVGADAGGGPVLKAFDRDGLRTATFYAFDPGFTGGVRVSTGDVTGDGIKDIIAGTGPGGTARIRVFSGQDNALILDLPVFEGFPGGVFVATGDLTGDGVADIVVTPDQGGGPRVLVFRGGDFAPIASFFGITDDAFRGGARAAVGDLNNDGRADLVVSAGFGGGPRVAIWNGTSIAGIPAKLMNDFFIFEPSLRNGLYPAIGDIDGDGFGELFAGAGPGGGPRVLVLSGQRLFGNSAIDAINNPKANFFAGNIESRGGVRVALGDLDGDTRADLLTGSGAGGTRVLAYQGADLAVNGAPGAVRDFFAFPGFPDGVFVG